MGDVRVVASILHNTCPRPAIASFFDRQGKSHDLPLRQGDLHWVREIGR